MEKVIELVPLAEIGRGRAKVTDNCVEIEVGGISGGMKAWLIGGEAVPIGNIVEGRLRKQIDTREHSGVLITQSGRQMLLGRYREEEIEEEKETPPDEKEQETESEENIEIEPDAEEIPFEAGDFNWEKVTRRSFGGFSQELRYILSNKSVYDNYKKHGHYWVGESTDGGALALRYEENEPDPLEFLGKLKFTKNGYVIVCVDKNTKRLYVPEER